MKFLISNDDGVNAPGLLALYEALLTIGEVKVVAPDTEQSGCASALTITKALYLQELSSGFVALNGSPADCVYLALQELYRDISFDCVITGINAGANLGQDVLFSGTFGAAVSAQLFGVPAIATSLVSNAATGAAKSQFSEYQLAAQEVVKLLTDTDILDKMRQLPYHVLNVNIPDVNEALDIKGRKVTSLGHAKIAKPVHQVVDPRGRDAYWLSLRKAQSAKAEGKLSAATLLSADHLPVEGSSIPNQAIDSPPLTHYETDIEAIAKGYISLSPVRLHHTPISSLDKIPNLLL